jgi:hypothetical protein
MINNNPDNNSSGEFNSEANGPINEANSSQTNSSRKYAEPFDEGEGLKANAINGEEELSPLGDGSDQIDQVNALPEDAPDFSAAIGGIKGKSSSTVNRMKEKISDFGQNEKIGKVKDVGRKGLAPIVGVLQRHSGDINPYIVAIGRALKAGVESLNQENASDADRTVGGWFSEASEWFGELKTRFESTNGSDLINYIEEEGRKRPGFMFAISYVAGLGFGRMGRHIGQRNVNDIPKPTATMH